MWLKTNQLKEIDVREPCKTLEVWCMKSSDYTLSLRFPPTFSCASLPTFCITCYTTFFQWVFFKLHNRLCWKARTTCTWTSKEETDKIKDNKNISLVFYWWYHILFFTLTSVHLEGEKQAICNSLPLLNHKMNIITERKLLFMFSSSVFGLPVLHTTARILEFATLILSHPMYWTEKNKQWSSVNTDGLPQISFLPQQC